MSLEPAVIAAALANVSRVAEQHLTVAVDAWWKDNGHIGQVVEEVAALRALAIEIGSGVACEVGFNAGHSAAVLLEGTGVRHLHEFDLMTQPYSNASAAHARARYPGRFTMHRGNSRQTLREHAARRWRAHRTLLRRRPRHALLERRSDGVRRCCYCRWLRRADSGA